MGRHGRHAEKEPASKPIHELRCAHLAVVGVSCLDFGVRSLTLRLPEMKTKALSKRAVPQAPEKRTSRERFYSSQVVDGVERAASRAMLYAVGFKKEDFKKPQIGVASTWSMVTPCNIHMDQLAVSVTQGINEAGGKAIVFNTI